MQIKYPHKNMFTSETYELIRQVRSEHKTYGKAKIAVILKRDHSVEISESSVGRILKKFRFPKSLSCPRYKRKRKFMSYAKRREFKLYSQMEIGKNLQIDHMVRTINGLTCRVFVACDKKSKWAYAEPFSKANSKNAAKFLRHVIKNAVFPIKSIQVDGGSELMKIYTKSRSFWGLFLVFKLTLNIMYITPFISSFANPASKTNELPTNDLEQLRALRGARGRARRDSNWENATRRAHYKYHKQKKKNLRLDVNIIKI